MKTRTHVRRHIRRIHGKKVGVVKHTRVLHKNLSYKQLKRKGSRIQPYADTDRDGKVNRFDCRPLNPQKQDNEVDSIAAKELGQYILSENGCFQNKGLDSELMSEEDEEETTFGKHTDEYGEEHVSYLMHSCADDTRIDFDEDKKDYFCTGCGKRFSKDIMKRRVYNAMNTANSDIRNVAMYANVITEIEQA